MESLKAARSLAGLVRTVVLAVVIAFGVVFSFANYPWLATALLLVLVALLIAVGRLRGRW